ncbi:MAG TPA: SDR family oxidoreductase [Gammaproteobacteria bacterium]|nr:SDR family oxidoreductase [Gammaproteobacteria bacterium]
MKPFGQVVVVGGSKGLGKVISERFIARGYTVTVISRNRPSDELRANHVVSDLETMISSDSVVNEAVRFGGKVRYLIFCQRYRGSGDPWQGEIQVTLMATRLMVNGFSDHFCEEGDRAICAVSSVYAEFVGGSQPDSYHVAKAGLNQLVKFNACILGRKGIRVNAIMPLTYLKAESKDFHLANSALMRLYQDFVPMRAIGSVDDSANLIEFLCSEKASFINGQAIFVDGGVSAIWPEELARSMAGI